MAVSDASAGLAKDRDVPIDIADDLQKRFHGFEVPDELFDPATASPALLRKYGLPPKPDPDRQPFLRKTWERGFGAPLMLQEFIFSRDRVQATIYRLHVRQADHRPFAETRFETSSNWSGAYIAANRDKRSLQIWGVWTIPANLKLPPAPFQGPPGIDYLCSNWIGLDGQRRYFDSSLPQIGTVSTLEADGTTTAQAWTQWWARGNANTAPLPLGLAVAPGNQVLSVLTALDSQTVSFVMVNLSAMTAMAVQGTAPTVTLADGTQATPDIAGATAEWIVERPAIPGQPTRYNFPDYGQTEFDLCVAIEGDDVDIFSLFGGLSQDLRGARFIRMYDRLNGPQRTAFISMPRKLNDTAISVRYGGF
jgi:peptidase A4-like protein